MVEHTLLFKAKSLNRKLQGNNIIAVAARHNLREILAERDSDSHIDQSRTHLNIVLRGEKMAAGVAGEAVRLMTQANIKELRANASLGIEVIISLPLDSGIKETAFFDAAVLWVETFYEFPILSAVIHNDEAAPHCHIVMLPLFEGRMIGGKLGNKTRIKAATDDLYAKVGQPFGLARPTPTKRHSHAARTAAANTVIDCISKTPKNLNDPAFIDALRDALIPNPMPLVVWFGLDMPESNTKATNQLKPKIPIGIKHKTPSRDLAQKEQSLSCVGVLDSAQTIEPAEAPIDDDYIRVREDELPAEEWHEGEAIKRPTNFKPKSKEVERVSGAIQAMRR